MNKQDGIVISRVFDAPRENIWKAWTEPDEIKKWWGPENFYAPIAKVDFRVGGKYIFAMHGPKGTQFDKDMYSAGEYKEIIPMEKLVITDYFSDENGNIMDPSDAGMVTDMPKIMDVIAKFEEVEGGKTKLTITYPRPTDEKQFEALKKSGLEDGWSTTLDKLAKSLQ